MHMLPTYVLEGFSYLAVLLSMRGGLSRFSRFDRFGNLGHSGRSVPRTETASDIDLSWKVNARMAPSMN